MAAVWLPSWYGSIPTDQIIQVEQRCVTPLPSTGQDQRHTQLPMGQKQCQKLAAGTFTQLCLLCLLSTVSQQLLVHNELCLAAGPACPGAGMKGRLVLQAQWRLVTVGVSGARGSRPAGRHGAGCGSAWLCPALLLTAFQTRAALASWCSTRSCSPCDRERRNGPSLRHPAWTRPGPAPGG